MSTNVRILADQVLAYGPQRVVAGQVLTVEDDSMAAWLVSQGIGVVDGVSPVNAAPLVDGGLPVNGDPGGNLEIEDQIG